MDTGPNPIFTRILMVVGDRNATRNQLKQKKWKLFVMNQTTKGSGCSWPQLLSEDLLSCHGPSPPGVSPSNSQSSHSVWPRLGQTQCQAGKQKSEEFLSAPNQKDRDRPDLRHVTMLDSITVAGGLRTFSSLIALNTGNKYLTARTLIPWPIANDPTEGTFTPCLYNRRHVYMKSQ